VKLLFWAWVSAICVCLVGLVIELTVNMIRAIRDPPEDD
jgi:hypothetical protein